MVSQVLINVRSAGRCDALVDYEYLDRVASADDGGAVRLLLVRHVLQRGDVLSDDDVSTAAGATILQIWIRGESREDCDAQEEELRANLIREGVE